MHAAAASAATLLLRSSLRRVKEVMREASFLYAELVQVRAAGRQRMTALQLC